MGKRGKELLMAIGMTPKRSSGGIGDEPDGDEGEGLELSEGVLAAAEEAMTAIEEKDVDAFARALVALIESHEAA